MSGEHLILFDSDWLVCVKGFCVIFLAGLIGGWGLALQAEESEGLEVTSPESGCWS